MATISIGEWEKKGEREREKGREKRATICRSAYTLLTKIKIKLN